MEQQEPPPPITTTVAAATTTTTSTTTTSTASTPPQPTPPPPETHPPQQPPVSTAPPDIPIQPLPNPNPNPNPNSNPNPIPTDPPKPLQQIQQPQQQPQQILQPRAPPPPSPSSSSSFSRPRQQPPLQPPQSASALAPVPLPPRGGIAIGVPTHHAAAAPSPPSSSPFPPSFNQQFGGNPRAPDSISSAAASQLRPPSAQGMHGVGMIGSMGSATQMRPGAIPQPRPVQQPIRPLSSPINQATTSQSFQGQSLMRAASSMGPPISATPNTQSLPSPNQPWLSSASQGKPPLPPPSYRPQMSAPSLQQRPHIPQQQQQQQHQHHHQLPIASQNHSSAQPQPQTQPQPPSPSPQSQDHYSQQFPPRVLQPLQHQQVARVQASGNQKAPSVAITQAQSSNPIPPSTNNISAVAEADESGNRILTKRSINELLNQIDPSEKLDSEVEDILVDIAEEFMESITTFGCSLAKHRKSTVLEAKDILLHLERNWNISLPGFSGDEIKSYRKPVSTDIHKERLAAIKKSLATAEAAAYAKNAAGQTVGNTRGNLSKAPANVLGSPNMKN